MSMHKSLLRQHLGCRHHISFFLVVIVASTVRIATAAGPLMSGSRPGISLAETWIRWEKYVAAFAHTCTSSGVGGPDKFLPIRRWQTSPSIASTFDVWTGSTRSRFVCVSVAPLTAPGPAFVMSLRTVSWLDINLLDASICASDV